MVRKKSSFYGIVSPDFNGVVRTFEAYNEKVKGKKGARGKKFNSNAEAQKWIDEQLVNTLKKEGYFAVYHPDLQEVVYTSKEFKEKVVGKKKTKGKKFNTEKEAQAWIGSLKQAVPEPVQKNTKFERKKEIVIYIDGSFKEPYGKFGFVAFEPMQEVSHYQDFGYVYDSRFNELKNIGAELMACIRALEWSYCNQMQVVHIIYDFNGIVEILRNKPKNGAYLVYFNIIEAFSTKMDIHFLHVRHGNKDLHKKAHQLAQLSII